MNSKARNGRSHRRGWPPRRLVGLVNDGMVNGKPATRSVNSQSKRWFGLVLVERRPIHPSTQTLPQTQTHAQTPSLQALLIPPITALNREYQRHGPRTMQKCLGRRYHACVCVCYPGTGPIHPRRQTDTPTKTPSSQALAFPVDHSMEYRDSTP